MAKKKDLTGQRFGRLTVLYDTGERRRTNVVWHCRCDCGNEVGVRGHDLTSGHTKSCGCLQRERAAEANIKHGMARGGEIHPVHHVWRSMLQRCENPNNFRYKDYGGRGIKVCDEWHDAQVFINWALANGWKKGLTLDRIDNDGNYEPSNCRWVTQKVQARNRRSSHLITFSGKTQTMVAWAEEAGIPYSVFKLRINRYHWSIERALTEPIGRHNYAS